MVNPILEQPVISTSPPSQFKTLSDKRLLVTGAAGFIGSALLKRLAEYGFDVIGTALYEDEIKSLKALGYNAIQYDLLDSESFVPVLKEIDVVFNLAAMFQEVDKDESIFYKANVDGTLRLAKQAAEAGVKRFVHCSTVGVHGHVKEIPCKETSPYNPMDEYHRSKLEGEKAVLEFGKTLSSDEMVVTVNRPAMVYGPGDLRMLKLFKTIAQGKFVMIGSGKVLAHLGYIEDQVDSFLLCAVKPKENVHLQEFNIASDNHITLNKLAALIAKHTGTRLKPFKIPVSPVWFASLLCELACRPFGIKPPIFRRRIGFFTHNRSFDLSKAQMLLGYTPQYSVEQGVKETIKWYKERGFF